MLLQVVMHCRLRSEVLDIDAFEMLLESTKLDLKVIDVLSTC